MWNSLQKGWRSAAAVAIFFRLVMMSKRGRVTLGKSYLHASPRPMPPANMPQTERRLAIERDDKPVRPWPLVQPAWILAPMKSKLPPKKAAKAPVEEPFSEGTDPVVMAGYSLKYWDAAVPAMTPKPIKS